MRFPHLNTIKTQWDARWSDPALLFYGQNDDRTDLPLTKPQPSILAWATKSVAGRGVDNVQQSAFIQVSTNSTPGSLERGRGRALDPLCPKKPLSKGQPTGGLGVGGPSIRSSVTKPVYLKGMKVSAHLSQV
jgi:hypothetical protein